MLHIEFNTHTHTHIRTTQIIPLTQADIHPPGRAIVIRFKTLTNRQNPSLTNSADLLEICHAYSFKIHF